VLILAAEQKTHVALTGIARVGIRIVNAAPLKGPFAVLIPAARPDQVVVGEAVAISIVVLMAGAVHHRSIVTLSVRVVQPNFRFPAGSAALHPTLHAVGVLVPALKISCVVKMVFIAVQMRQWHALIIDVFQRFPHAKNPVILVIVVLMRNVALVVCVLYLEWIWPVAVMGSAYVVRNVVRIRVAVKPVTLVVMTEHAQNQVSHAVVVIIFVHWVKNVVLVGNASTPQTNVVDMVSV
jgi:hypothetical protein